MNVDLCFVPAARTEIAQKLPAVSGSSGRLLVENTSGTESERDWPGQVFADESLDYTDPVRSVLGEQAMLDFVAASRAQAEPNTDDSLSTAASLCPPVSTAEQSREPSLKAQKRDLRRAAGALRDARRAARQQRKQEDAAWQTLKTERRKQKAALAEEPRAARRAYADTWRAVRQQRRATLQRRQAEDAVWHENRHQLRERLAQLPIITAWIAVLVITDNCTRQCLGLPLFMAGPRVTAELIVDALSVLLPPELKFLITDRGTHTDPVRSVLGFTAGAFQELMRTEEFIHVLIARHRPESNGIAERFVRTLKEWLRDKTWQNDAELAVLLAQFRYEYNDRPHHPVPDVLGRGGLAIPGLSPNEFANRIWLT